MADRSHLRSISFQCDLPRHEWNDDNHHKVQPRADPRLIFFTENTAEMLKDETSVNMMSC